MLDIAARIVWRAPGRFGLVRLLGPSYSLRCVVFHDVSETESPFTKGMGVRITPDDLKSALEFLTRYYTPVSLHDVLTGSDGRGLPPRPVLVTFDDGYASVAEAAVPLCRTLGVPAVLFLNAAVFDNDRLAADNLVCYVANVVGMELINSAARALKGPGAPQLQRLADVFRQFFPYISPSERQSYLQILTELAGLNERQLARKASLYLTGEQVRELAFSDCEIGNHTYNHVHCRSLTSRDIACEIDRNKAELEAVSGTTVRSFSVPYGSLADLTSSLVEHLSMSGHQATFLSQSVSNPPGSKPLRFDRVSTLRGSADSLFLEIEVLPRLRTMRNRFYPPSIVN